jgi:YD repeat-containing protein
MASRAQNERKFKHWKELPNGGRRYIREFVGRAGGRALYIKEVDADERTTRFAQEIYDAADRLTAVHEKFPVDLGHKRQ